MSKKSVIVIGSGLGGLASAIRLAKIGFDVTVFEQHSQLGGKMGETRIGPYRFDTGPSILTMPFVVDELFDYAGLRRTDLLDFQALNPICRYFFSDATSFDAQADQKSMVASIRNRFSAREAHAYEKFLRYSERIYNITAETFLFHPIHEFRKNLRLRHLAALARLPWIDPLRSMHAGICRFFSDPKLIQIFDRFATYNGSNPFKAPATLNVIPHVEFTLGSYYIKGGMYRLAQTLGNIAQALGTTIRYPVKVERIVHNQKRVTGVIANGKQVSADYIVCNVDVTTAFNKLIDGFEKHRTHLNNLEPSSSAVAFLWGVNTRNNQLRHHNVLFSASYKTEFRQIFDEKRAPEDPTVYIAITNRAELSDAPVKGENWFVLVNMPYLDDRQLAYEEVMRVRETVMEKLKTIGIDIRHHIEVEDIITPRDFAHFYNSNRGGIYGISSNSMQSAFKRPANRSRHLERLYFAGGSAHPGGGIPLTLLSGKITADLISEAEGKSVTDRRRVFTDFKKFYAGQRLDTYKR